MRENPYEGKNPDDVTFAGDNFMRTTGDSQNFYEMQHFAWEACHDKPDIPNIFAEPSQAAVLFESYKQKKRELEENVKTKLIKEYGGDQHTKVPPKMLLIGQTEVYQEYTPDGSIVKGNETIPKSKYEEDVHINNHTSVWGSYYDTSSGKWGYHCCKQLEKQSFCMKAPLVAPDAVAVLKAKLQEQTKSVEDGKEREGEGKKEKKPRKKENGKEGKKKKSSESESSTEESESESSSEDKKKKKKKRSKSKKSKSKKKSKKSRKTLTSKKDKRTKEQDLESEPVAKTTGVTSKKRRYDSMPEEMEQYKRQQVRWDDPMRKME